MELGDAKPDAWWNPAGRKEGGKPGRRPLGGCKCKCNTQNEKREVGYATHWVLSVVLGATGLQP